MLRLIFKRTKPNKLGRWNYTNAERKIDLANVDHCGTCILNPIPVSYTHLRAHET